MKTHHQLLILGFLAIGLTLSGSALFGKGPEKGGGNSGLDMIEASHLTFMREEEKLARDVYLTFSERYPQQPLFNTIASRS